jgi:1,4-alpha-glucan branching enzyme
VVTASDTGYTGTSYGVATGQAGRWQQILCSPGRLVWRMARRRNAFYDPWTQAVGHIYINVPQWSVVMFRLL